LDCFLADYLLHYEALVGWDLQGVTVLGYHWGLGGLCCDLAVTPPVLILVEGVSTFADLLLFNFGLAQREVNLDAGPGAKTILHLPLRLEELISIAVA